MVKNSKIKSIVIKSYFNSSFLRTKAWLFKANFHNFSILSRSSHQRCSIKKVLLIKRLWHSCFPVNFAKFFRGLFYRTCLDNCFCPKGRGGSRTAATSKMERFVIIVNGFQPLTIITKPSILDAAAVLDRPLS